MLSDLLVPLLCLVLARVAMLCISHPPQPTHFKHIPAYLTAEKCSIYSYRSRSLLLFLLAVTAHACFSVRTVIFDRELSVPWSFICGTLEL